MDDVRYFELRFLSAIASGSIPHFWGSDPQQSKAFSPKPDMYVEMAVALIEDLYVRFRRDDYQLFVARLRGELSPTYPRQHYPQDHLWDNPREGLRSILSGELGQQLCITYRGLRRIEELRDLLRRDRILEHFGVLLDLRYLQRDLEDALQRGPDVNVSVIYADMDDFGKINKQFGQAAGDVVMKAYLEVVRDCLGELGKGYRGLGDETVGLIVGQGHQRAVEVAETIRSRVVALQCSYKDQALPGVTASIGVASIPPEQRSGEVETLAEERKRIAKRGGKNRVIAG